MFNLGANPKIKGSGVLILNGLRVCTVIGLVAMMASSWAMIVLAGLAGRFDFYDTMAHIFVFLFAVFLTISEVDLFKGYFEANWPIFSVSHSLAWLGVFLIGLAMQVLSNLEKDKYSQQNLGMPIHRLVLASGILNVIFGAFNIIASVIFRDGAHNITARQIRADGRLAAPAEAYGGYGSYSKHSASIHEEKEQGISRARRFTQMMNPRNIQQQFRRSRIQISKPLHVEHISSDMDIERGGDDNLTMVNEDRSSPIFPGIQRPPTALHPFNTGRSSRYSEANMSRF
ncbi:hypothetical protein DL546_004057 [Coniochaeta pulveracea]|nr:hypothetical protein DL546_004057 [Coniochaeta pulveracea]